MQNQNEITLRLYYMIQEIRVGTVDGVVSVPSSKSILQRAMIAALLAKGVTNLLHVVHCQDTLSCLAAIESLGAEVSGQSESMLKITGRGGIISPEEETVSVHESGFAARALASVAALSQKKILLNGSGSLLQRPFGFCEKVLPQLGVQCKTQNGFLPMKIQGPMRFADITVDGSQSSQFLSGLLMVYPLAGSDHTIEVNDLRSKSYVDLTIQVLKKFGIEIRNENYQRFFIRGNQSYRSCSLSIEGDWSAAAFMLVAGAIAGTMKIKNLDHNSVQPDKAIMGILRSSGASVILDNEVAVRKTELWSFTYDATDTPDLFPPLVALAACCEGISEIYGVDRLVHKESNRALALQLEFGKLNDKLIMIEGNKMTIQGNLELKHACVDSHNDHRIAMALAIIALKVTGGLKINGAESVAKSYPNFFHDLQSATTNP